MGRRRSTRGSSGGAVSGAPLNLAHWMASPRERGVWIWLAVAAVTLFPFVHVHVGTIGPHGGDHRHLPLVHSVFAADEAVHPPSESGADIVLDQTSGRHGLGQEIQSLPGSSTPGVFVTSLFAHTSPSPPAVAALSLRPVLCYPIDLCPQSIVPRAPPIPSLS